MTTPSLASPSHPSSNHIEFVLLKGHSGSVLCLDHSNNTARHHQSHHHSASTTSGSSNNNSNNNNSSSWNSTLLSGSEDGTCRLWDLRTGLRASLCIRCSDHHFKIKDDDGDNESRDVLSVSFGPLLSPPTSMSVVDTDQKTATLTREYSVYTAVGRHVYGYDLRYITSPIITIPSYDTSFLDCTDEINQIVFAPTNIMSSPSIVTAKLKQRSGKGAIRTTGSTSSSTNATTRNSYSVLATADDSGIVQVMDLIETDETKQKQQQRPNRQLTLIHNDSALVTSIAYRPQRYQRLNDNSNNGGKNKKAPSMLLASGGTDCCIRLWDVGSSTGSSMSQSSSTLPISTISIPPTSSSSSESNQVCNPPMVHCLQWSPSGRLLAAGLGDGSVAIMHLPTTTTTTKSVSSLLLSHRIDDAHSGTVASCLFPAWTSYNYGNSNDAITAHDRLMCTAGNDGCIAFWDLGENIGSDKANNPTNLFSLPNDNNTHTDDHQKLGAKKRSTKVSKPNATMDDLDDSIDLPHTLFAFQHPVKPNWMIHSGINDISFPYSLFVADTSNTITAYTVPIR